MSFNPLIPQKGDVWSRPDMDFDITILSATPTMIKCHTKFGIDEHNIPTWNVMATESLRLGASVNRGGLIYTKEIADYEV